MSYLTFQRELIKRDDFEVLKHECECGVSSNVGRQSAGSYRNAGKRVHCRWVKRSSAGNYRRDQRQNSCGNPKIQTTLSERVRARRLTGLKSDNIFLRYIRTNADEENDDQAPNGPHERAESGEREIATQAELELLR